MELILKYFPNLTDEQQSQFAALFDLYSEWNAKINVVSRKDIDLLYERHVLHSLGIAVVKQFKHDDRVLDVGTGGGFPGIPLAIMFPQTQFHLVDSIGKKIKVVNGVREALKLENVVAEQARAEQLDGQYDWVVSRAVTRLPEFIGWIKKRIKKSENRPNRGILYLKGGDLTEELQAARDRHPQWIKGLTEIPLSNYFSEEFFETKAVVRVLR